MKNPSKKKQIRLLKRALDDSNYTVKNLRIELATQEVNYGMQIYDNIYLKEKIKEMIALIDKIRL